MHPIHILYCDAKTNRIFKTVPFEYDYIPVKHNSFYTASRVARPFEKDLRENPLNYIWYDNMGPVPTNIVLTDDEKEAYRLLVARINIAEYLWSTFKSYLYNVTQDVYPDHISKELIEYEMKTSIFADKDSWSNQLRVTQHLELDAFMELQRLNKEILYRKKRELYKSLMESQDRILASDKPEEQLITEIRQVCYVW